MKFAGIKSIDDLLRKQEWDFFVVTVKEASETNDKSKVRNLLEKELNRCKKKQKHYNREVKVLKKLLQKLEDGISVDNIEDLIDQTQEESLEEYEPQEIKPTTEEEIGEYNRLLRERDTKLY